MSSTTVDRALGAYALGSAVINGWVYAAYFAAGPQDLLWFCNVAFLVLAAGFFLKKNIFVSAVLIAAIHAQSFWILGHVAAWLGDVPPGRFRWLGNAPWGRFFELNYHLGILPLAVVGVWRHGYHRRALIASIVIFIPLLFASRLWTDPRANINCMFYPCDMAYSGQVFRSFGWAYALKRIALLLGASAALHVIFLRILPGKKA